MNIRKGNPPINVAREIEVDLSREEVLSVLSDYAKAKLGLNLVFNDLAVHADDKDNLQEMTLGGVELVALDWHEPLVNKVNPPK